MQALPSSHVVPSATGACVHLPAPLQPSTVQELPSSQAAGEQAAGAAEMARGVIGGGGRIDGGAAIVCLESTAKATQPIAALVATTRAEPFPRSITGASRTMILSSWMTFVAPVVIVTVAPGATPSTAPLPEPIVLPRVPV